MLSIAAAAAVVVAATACVALLVGWQQQRQRYGGRAGRTSEKKKNNENENLGTTSKPDDATHREKEELLLLLKLETKFREAKRDLYERLRREYGTEAFRSVFMVPTATATNASSTNRSTSTTETEQVLEKSRGRTYFGSTIDNDEGVNVGFRRFKRKMTVKILQSLLVVRNNDDNKNERQQRQPRGRGGDESGSASFVWASAGHSSAAGHGNFFNQSYAAVMERAAAPLFAAVGLKFEARNYAMGAHRSGPELAMCAAAIYGNDYDVVSWDFAQTDKRSLKKSELFLYRALLGIDRDRDRRPAAFIMEAGGKGPDVQSLLKNGAAVLEEVGLKGATTRVPDSAGVDEIRVREMPSFVRNFRCGRSVESGDPRCADEKFDTATACPKRRWTTSWHPGWKFHALRGNFMALFLADVLEESLRDIVASTMSREALLRELVSQDRADHERFLASDLPKHHGEWLTAADVENVTESHLAEVRRILYKQHNYCHTAQLPAEIRYKGILFPEKGPVDMFELNRIDGDDVLLDSKAGKRPNDSDGLRLVTSTSQRQQCPILLNIDHDDYFYLHEKEGWKEITVPNDAEIQEYGSGGGGDDDAASNALHLTGLISICYLFIPHEDFVVPGNIINGIADDYVVGTDVKKKVEITVNDMRVASTAEVGGDACYFLRHGKDGGSGASRNRFFFQSNDQGKFTIRVRVNSMNGYIRIRSIVVW